MSYFKAMRKRNSSPNPPSTKHLTREQLEAKGIKVQTTFYKEHGNAKPKKVDVEVQGAAYHGDNIAQVEAQMKRAAMVLTTK